MRHRVAVLGTSEATRMLALLLVARDDCDLVLDAEDGGPLQSAARALGAEPRVQGPVDATALTAVALIVVGESAGVDAADLGRRAPDALLVVATATPQDDARGLQATLRWPRQRVLGIDANAANGPAAQRAAAAARLVDCVLADRRCSVPATVQTDHAGAWGSVPVRLGAVGVLAIEP